MLRVRVLASQWVDWLVHACGHRSAGHSASSCHYPRWRHMYGTRSWCYRRRRPAWLSPVRLPVVLQRAIDYDQLSLRTTTHAISLTRLYRSLLSTALLHCQQCITQNCVRPSAMTASRPIGAAYSTRMEHTLILGICVHACQDYSLSLSHVHQWTTSTLTITRVIWVTM